MEISEHKKLLAKILENSKDPAVVSDLVTQLAEDNTKLVGDLSSTSNNLEKMQADNEQLRAANMKLFLKVGEPEQTDDTIKNGKQDNTPKYEDLFDESGNLK